MGYARSWLDNADADPSAVLRALTIVFNGVQPTERATRRCLENFHSNMHDLPRATGETWGSGLALDPESMAGPLGAFWNPKVTRDGLPLINFFATARSRIFLLNKFPLPVNYSELFLNDVDFAVRAELARRADLPADVQERLATDVSPQVRMRLANNLNVEDGYRVMAGLLTLQVS